jgi:hypothetical protein
MVLSALICNWLKLSRRTSRKFGLWFTKYCCLECPFIVLFKNVLQRINMVKNIILQKCLDIFDQIELKENKKRVCCLQAFKFY